MSRHPARAPQLPITAYRWGDSIAHVPLPEHLRDHIASIAVAFHQAQVASDYAEQVDTITVPRGFATLRRTWVPPAAALAEKGFRLPSRTDPVAPTKEHFVLTTGVDPHADHYLGPTLLWTLHNDGLEFWQRGGVRRTPLAGDILIFDDGIDHSMDLPTDRAKNPAYEAAVWVGWALPLQIGPEQRQRPSRCPTSMFSKRSAQTLPGTR